MAEREQLLSLGLPVEFVNSLDAMTDGSVLSRLTVLEAAGAGNLNPAIQDEGTPVVQVPVAIDFRGAGVTVSAPGGSVARVTIPWTTDAALLTSGELSDARLSSNIPKNNAANTFTASPQTVQGAVAANTTTTGHALANTATATAGNQRHSLATLWTGSGWKTDGGGDAQAVEFRAYTKPVEGAAAPTGRWTLESKIGGGGWGTVLTVGNAGELAVSGPIAHTGTTVGFMSATPAVQQASGADLTNNVANGGTDNIIDNWTDLTTYATDAASIRNAVYQLARKLKQVNDGLRVYGLLA